MSKNRSAAGITNIVQYDANKNITFVSGSATLLTVSSSGALTTTGTITAQTLVVQTITSSVNFVTGSTKFGAIVSNTHQFTGSLNVTGSLSVVTTGTEFQVNATGVNLGNVLTDSHVISGSLRVNPNGLFVSSSGNVGIGTTTTSGRLDVQAPGTSAFSYYFRNSNGGYAGGVYNTGANHAQLYLATSAGTENILLNSTGSSYFNGGNIGIGTSSPSINLHITSAGMTLSSTTTYSSATTKGIVIEATNGATDVGSGIWFNNSQLYAGIGSARSNVNNWGTDLRFFTHPDTTSNQYDLTERMRITSGGNIQIDSGQLNTPKSLYFAANSSSGGSLGDISWYNYQWDGLIRAQIKGETDTGLSNGKLTFWTGGGGVSLRMTINAAGSIGAPSGTNIYNASDIRLKRNISTITDGLSKVSALNPVKFNWIEGFEPTEENKDMLGFIAQEVQEIVPEAVENFNNNAITVGDTVIENSLRVNEKFIIPVLVKAIQELKAEIDALKAQ